MMGLETAGLNVRLGGRPILSDIGVAFEAGRVTAILGPNGAGKSTLLSCLAGLRRPVAGSVRLDGNDLFALAPRARARRMAFIPQTPEIAWAVEARILVGLGRTPYIGARGLSSEDAVAIDRAMERAGVSAFADRDVTTLSGGERARVMIARALAGDPAWLLADEPLAGLDPGHQLDAATLFRRLAAEDGRGIIVTLHDLSLAARMADRIVLLVEGRVLADGTPAEALTISTLRAAYGVETRIHQGPDGLLIDVLGRAG